MTENLTMPASEAIGKGLSVYQIVVALGAGLALLAGVWILLFPISSQNIGSLGSGNVSLVKFGSIAVGLLSAGIGTVFFLFLKSLKSWFGGVAAWTYGDNINSVTLDDISSSIRRWLSVGQWLPALYIGVIVICLLLGPAVPAAFGVALGVLSVGVFLFPAFGMVAFLTFLLAFLGPISNFSQGTVSPIYPLSDSLKSALLISTLLFAAFNLPLVAANWIGLERVKTWVRGVTGQFARRAKGRVGLLELSKKLALWFTAAQILQGALSLLLIYSLIVRGALGGVITVLSLNFFAGLYFAFIALGPLALYVTTFLLLQWTRPFMDGVSYYIDTFLGGQQSA